MTLVSRLTLVVALAVAFVGAPADLVVSADLDWMDHVEKAKMVKDGTRSNWLGNTLVLFHAATASLNGW